MKFTVNLTKEHFAQFQQFSTKQVNEMPGMNWKVNTFGVVFWCLLTIFVILIFRVYDNNCCRNYTYLNVALIVLLVWFLMSVAWQTIYLKLYASYAVVEGGSTLGEWHFEIEEDGFKEYGKLITSYFKWESIKLIKKDNHNLYLFLDPAKAFILPLSQINDEIEAAIRKYVSNN